MGRIDHALDIVNGQDFGQGFNGEYVALTELERVSRMSCHPGNYRGVEDLVITWRVNHPDDFEGAAWPEADSPTAAILAAFETLPVEQREDGGS